MKKFILFLFLIVAYFGNSQNIDNSFVNTKEQHSFKEIDTTYISELIKKATHYYSVKKLDSTYYFYNTAFKLADSIDSKEQMAKCLYGIGVYYDDVNNYNESINYLKKANVIYEELGNLSEVARNQNLIGFNHFILGKEDKSIENYFKSITIYKNINDNDGVGVNYIDIGNLYYANENYDFARRYFEDALEIYLQLDDKSGIAVCYTNIGNATSDSGMIDKGIEYFIKSIKIQEELEDFIGIGINYNNIGDCYIMSNQYEKAQNYFFKALEIAKKENDEDLIAIVYLNLSDLNNKVHKYNEAILYANKSLKIAKRIGIISYELENLKNLSFAYEKLGDVTKALELLKEYKLINESVLKSENIKKVELFNTLNELEKSNFTIKELNIQNELAQVKYENEKKITYGLILAITIFAFFIIILIIQQTSKKKAYNLLAFKNHQIKRMNDEIQLQRDNLNQLNTTKNKFFSIIAHDLKNPFNSIKGFTELLIENINEYDEEKILKFLKIIKGATSNASSLLENLLIWANSQSGNLVYNPRKIELVKLVSNVISLLEIQAINKEVSINNRVHDNLIVFADENMLNTILRNLISNAIKFSNAKGCIQILSTIKGDFVEITIKDNGIGMSKEIIHNLFNIETKSSQIGTANEQGSGLGLILCKDFVEKNGGEIWVESILNEGSEFKFTIPKFK